MGTRTASHSRMGKTLVSWVAWANPSGDPRLRRPLRVCCVLTISPVLIHAEVAPHTVLKGAGGFWRGRPRDAMVNRNRTGRSLLRFRPW